MPPKKKLRTPFSIETRTCIQRRAGLRSIPTITDVPMSEISQSINCSVLRESISQIENKNQGILFTQESSETVGHTEKICERMETPQISNLNECKRQYRKKSKEILLKAQEAAKTVGLTENICETVKQVEILQSMCSSNLNESESQCRKKSRPTEIVIKSLEPGEIVEATEKTCDPVETPQSMNSSNLNGSKCHSSNKSEGKFKSQKKAETVGHIEKPSEPTVAKFSKKSVGSAGKISADYGFKLLEVSVRLENLQFNNEKHQIRKYKQANTSIETQKSTVSTEANGSVIGIESSDIQKVTNQHDMQPSSHLTSNCDTDEKTENQLSRILTSSPGTGYNDVTQENEMIYLDNISEAKESITEKPTRTLLETTKPVYYEVAIDTEKEVVFHLQSKESDELEYSVVEIETTDIIEELKDTSGIQVTNDEYAHVNSDLNSVDCSQFISKDDIGMSQSKEDEINSANFTSIVQIDIPNEEISGDNSDISAAVVANDIRLPQSSVQSPSINNITYKQLELQDNNKIDEVTPNEENSTTLPSFTMKEVNGHMGVVGKIRTDCVDSTDNKTINNMKLQASMMMVSNYETIEQGCQKQVIQTTQKSAKKNILPLMISTMLPQDMQQKLRAAIGIRYKSHSKVLNLRELHSDNRLRQGCNCSLADPTTMMFVVDVIAIDMPNLIALDLSGNSLQDLDELAPLAKKATCIKLLILRNNLLLDLAVLEPIKTLCLQSLVLQGNPLKNKYINNGKEYVQAVKKIFPLLKRLDDEDISSVENNMGKKVTKISVKSSDANCCQNNKDEVKYQENLSTAVTASDDKTNNQGTITTDNLLVKVTKEIGVHVEDQMREYVLEDNRKENIVVQNKPKIPFEVTNIPENNSNVIITHDNTGTNIPGSPAEDKPREKILIEDKLEENMSAKDVEETVNGEDKNEVNISEDKKGKITSIEEKTSDAIPVGGKNHFPKDNTSDNLHVCDEAIPFLERKNLVFEIQTKENIPAGGEGGENIAVGKKIMENIPVDIKMEEDAPIKYKEEKTEENFSADNKSKETILYEEKMEDDALVKDKGRGNIPVEDKMEECISADNEMGKNIFIEDKNDNVEENMSVDEITSKNESKENVPGEDKAIVNFPENMMEDVTAEDKMEENISPIFVDNVGEILPVEVQENIRTTMKSRFHATSKSLNLKALYKDVAFMEMSSSPGSCLKVFSFIMEVISSDFSDILALDLSDNSLDGQYLKVMSPLAIIAPKLKVLLLKNNNIEDVSHLEALGSLGVQSVMLQGNPLRKNYNKECDYMAAVKKIFRQLRRLDDSTISVEKYCGFVQVKKEVLQKWQQKHPSKQFSDGKFKVTLSKNSETIQTESPLSPELQQQVKDAIALRFTHKPKYTLDLQQLYSEPTLEKDLAECSLPRSDLITFMVKVIGMSVSVVKVLNLSGNQLDGKTLELLKPLIPKAIALKELSLENNCISDVQHLNVIGGFQLKTLNLQNNPLQEQYKFDQTSYCQAVRNIFPHLIRLDDIDLTDQSKAACDNLLTCPMSTVCNGKLLTQSIPSELSCKELTDTRRIALSETLVQPMSTESSSKLLAHQIITKYTDKLLTTATETSDKLSTQPVSTESTDKLFTHAVISESADKLLTISTEASDKLSTHPISDLATLECSISLPSTTSNTAQTNYCAADAPTAISAATAVPDTTTNMIMPPLPSQSSNTVSIFVSNAAEELNSKSENDHSLKEQVEECRVKSPFIGLREAPLADVTMVPDSERIEILNNTIVSDNVNLLEVNIPPRSEYNNSNKSLSQETSTLGNVIAHLLTMKDDDKVVCFTTLMSQLLPCQRSKPFSKALADLNSGDRLAILKGMFHELRTVYGGTSLEELNSLMIMLKNERDALVVKDAQLQKHVPLYPLLQEHLISDVVHTQSIVIASPEIEKNITEEVHWSQLPIVITPTKPSNSVSEEDNADTTFKEQSYFKKVKRIRNLIQQEDELEIIIPDIPFPSVENISNVQVLQSGNLEKGAIIKLPQDVISEVVQQLGVQEPNICGSGKSATLYSKTLDSSNTDDSVVEPEMDVEILKTAPDEKNCNGKSITTLEKINERIKARKCSERGDSSSTNNIAGRKTENMKKNTSNSEERTKQTVPEKSVNPSREKNQSKSREKRSHSRERYYQSIKRRRSESKECKRSNSPQRFRSRRRIISGERGRRSRSCDRRVQSVVGTFRQSRLLRPYNVRRSVSRERSNRSVSRDRNHGRSSVDRSRRIESTPGMSVESKERNNSKSPLKLTTKRKRNRKRSLSREIDQFLTKSRAASNRGRSPGERSRRIERAQGKCAEGHHSRTRDKCDSRTEGCSRSQERNRSKDRSLSKEIDIFLTERSRSNTRSLSKEIDIILLKENKTKVKNELAKYKSIKKKSQSNLCGSTTAKTLTKSLASRLNIMVKVASDSKRLLSFPQDEELDSHEVQYQKPHTNTQTEEKLDSSKQSEFEDSSSRLRLDEKPGESIPKNLDHLTIPLISCLKNALHLKPRSKLVPNSLQAFAAEEQSDGEKSPVRDTSTPVNIVLHEEAESQQPLFLRSTTITGIPYDPYDPFSSFVYSPTTTTNSPTSYSIKSPAQISISSESQPTSVSQAVLYTTPDTQEVSSTQPNTEDSHEGTSDTIYVTNLPHGCSAKLLRDQFLHCGNVTYAATLQNNSGIIQFQLSSEAEYAQLRMEGSSFNGNTIQVCLYET